MIKSYADQRGTLFDAESNGPRWPYRLRHLWIVIAVALLACGWPQQGARAEVKKPIGDTGDVQEQQPDLCQGSNSFLYGLKVRVGDWMDQLSLICGQLDSSGNVTGKTYGPARGGNEPNPPPAADVTCGPNEIMTGVAFLFTPNNRQVRMLSFHCVSLKVGVAASDLPIGNTTHGGPSNVRQDCRPGEAINGLQVNYGKHVNAVGISCAAIPTQAPPPPTATLQPLQPGQTTQGPFGGPGGGAFQTMCNSGDEVTGIDTIEKNGVIVRIAPVCGHRQTDPLATYPRAWVGTDGTDPGPGVHHPRCEPGAVLTQFQVFVGAIPLVSAVGFTCWNWKTNIQTSTLANYGTYSGPQVTSQHEVCPPGQIAVGIFGHAGTAIDQLGLVCGAWTVTQAAVPSLPPNPLNQKILAYARAHLGQCFIDANGDTQPTACPQTANNNTVTGPGECTYLVQSAVVASGGQPPNYNVPKTTNSDGSAGQAYTWGDPVQPPYEPGDIIQFTTTKFVGPDNTTVVSYTDSQHTAIIESIGAGNDLKVINENNPIRIVDESEFNLSWKLIRGSYQVFRARAAH
jgi:hypothetical protein